MATDPLTEAEAERRDPESLEKDLIDVLLAGGWDVVKAPSAGLSALIRRSGRRYALELGHCSQARHPVLEGLLAAAVLRARRAAREQGAQPLAVVAAPVITDRALTQLGDFVTRYGEGAAWGAIDLRGLVALQGAGLEGLGRRPLRRRRQDPLDESRDGARPSIFTDLSQWMLKVLLSYRLPERLQLRDAAGRRIGAPAWHATNLAMLAGVSYPSAARFLAALRSEGHWRGGEPVQLFRVDELLARWRAAEVAAGPPLDLAARWIFDDLPRGDRLVRLLEDPECRASERCCLGLASAAKQMGFDPGRDVSPHFLYLEDRSREAIHNFGLDVAPPGEPAEVLVRVPRSPEAVFRGSVRGRDEAPASDVIQCWLDAASDPVRGARLAKQLEEQVVRPSLLKE